MVKIERRAKKLLDSETMIWLTTVGSDGTPQPRPVWFVPDGEDVLIYSQPEAAKVTHIRKHPHVALHFNADKWGSDETVVVLTGEATLGTPQDPQLAAYVKKYKEDMAGLGMTPAQFAASYSTPIRVKINNVR